MRPKIITAIGILTIVMAIVSFFVPYQVSVGGTWFMMDATGLFFILSYFVYYGVVMSIASLVIGISTLRQRMWAWKANVAFLITSIAIILASLIVQYASISGNDFAAISYPRPFSVILALVILYLLFRPETRRYYQEKPIAS
jgi:hypothetical protein